MNNSERLRHYEQMVLNLTEFPDQEWVLELFRFQATTNPVYKKYLALLGEDPSLVRKLDDIPFLPIEFFKNHSVKAGSWNHQQVFTSSGTTGQQTSKHYLYSESFYKQHSQNCFESFYGDLKEYCVLALLPAYLERKGSSLVYMADHFIKTSLGRLEIPIVDHLRPTFRIFGTWIRDFYGIVKLSSSKTLFLQCFLRRH